MPQDIVTTAASHGGPSLFVDVLILLAMIGGYAFVAFKEYTMKNARAFLCIVLPFAVLLGFFTSTYGMVAFMWIWIAAVTGVCVRLLSDRRQKKANSGE